MYVENIDNWNYVAREIINGNYIPYAMPRASKYDIIALYSINILDSYGMIRSNFPRITYIDILPKVIIFTVVFGYSIGCAHYARLVGYYNRPVCMLLDGTDFRTLDPTISNLGYVCGKLDQFLRNEVKSIFS